MKAALFEKPHVLNLIAKNLRPLGSGEALVRVQACGVCGTDVHIVEGTSRSTPPVVLGHEYAGVVEDVFGNEGTYTPGQRVAVDPNISCGTCFYCRKGLVHLCMSLRALGVDIDGGMAEFCIVPVGQLHEIPRSLSVEQSAFIEPVSCAVHGIEQARIEAGSTVVIVGGGTIGLMMLQLAKNAGAARTILVEPLRHKQEIARQLAADNVLTPEESAAAIRDLSHVGADVVIECVGRPETATAAIAYARRGGTVLFFGVCPVGVTIPVEPNAVYFRELTIIGSYLNPGTFSRSIEALEKGIVRLDKFQIHRFPLEGVHEAIAYQREGKTIKSIITPGS